ncbi:hypothetical protein ACFL6Y_06475 [Elusimicrobiota bacterium]
METNNNMCIDLGRKDDPTRFDLMKDFARFFCLHPGSRLRAGCDMAHVKWDGEIYFGRDWVPFRNFMYTSAYEVTGREGCIDWESNKVDYDYWDSADPDDP